MFSVFSSFVFVLLAYLVPETEGQCRTLRFTSARIDNHLLKNHVVRTTDVINEELCSMQCYLEPNCVSYNFKKEKEDSGQHKCDLNNDTFEHDSEHAGYLVKTDTYVYRGAQNSCAKKPCKNNATCQAGFTDKHYQCLCTPGFTGHDCLLDINECAKGAHSCGLNSVCNNIQGSFYCTCKDGFVGDGKECTDIDECANGTHSCDDNAVCNNTQGSYNCTCKDGFVGDNCTDIDECSAHFPECEAGFEENCGAISVPDPIALYPLNGKYKTREINNRQPHGTRVGVSLVAGPDGEPCGSHRFSGQVNSYVQFPNNGGLDAHHSITMLCWIYPENKAGPLFSYTTSGSWGVHLWVIEPGNLFAHFVEINYQNTTHLFAGHAQLELKEWYYVGASYDHNTGNAVLWLNGREVVQQNIGAGITLATQDKDVRMGVKEGDSRYFKGRITAMQIYDVALTAEQINKVKNAGRDTWHCCDFNAMCHNTPGSYECSCADGFSGDGKYCTDIDECANGAHSCDVNAVCNNIQGSYNCTCKDGFVGDGDNCTEKPQSVIICEGSTSTISCENGKTIKVLNANYGRLNKQTCIDNNMNNIYCTSSNSLEIVQQECDRKPSCTVSASNSVFGDPCGGTSKYLELKYRCMENIDN